MVPAIVPSTALGASPVRPASCVRGLGGCVGGLRTFEEIGEAGVRWAHGQDTARVFNIHLLCVLLDEMKLS